MNGETVLPLVLGMQSSADYLGISYETLRNYVNQGLIVPIQYPSTTHKGQPRRKKQFRRETLDAFMAGCERKPRPEQTAPPRPESSEVGPELGPNEKRKPVETLVNVVPKKRDQREKNADKRLWYHQFS